MDVVVVTSTSLSLAVVVMVVVSIGDLVASGVLVVTGRDVGAIVCVVAWALGLGVGLGVCNGGTKRQCARSGGGKGGGG